MDCKVIPLYAALVEADTTLWETDEVVFAFFKLEGIDIKLLVDVARVEEKGVGRDRKQRLGQLPDTLNVEVLQILRS